MTGNGDKTEPDGFAIFARLLRWGIWGLGTVLGIILLLAGTLVPALTAFVLFLVLGYWASLLITDFRGGRLLLPHGYIYRDRQPAAFWIFLIFYSVLLPALLLAAAGYHLGF